MRKIQPCRNLHEYKAVHPWYEICKRTHWTSSHAQWGLQVAIILQHSSWLRGWLCMRCCIVPDASSASLQKESIWTSAYFPPTSTNSVSATLHLIPRSSANFSQLAQTTELWKQQGMKRQGNQFNKKKNRGNKRNKERSWEIQEDREWGESQWNTDRRFWAKRKWWDWCPLRNSEEDLIIR